MTFEWKIVKNSVRCRTTSTNSFIVDAIHKPPNRAVSCVVALRGRDVDGFECAKRVKRYSMGAMVDGLLIYIGIFLTHDVLDIGLKYYFTCVYSD